MLISYDLGPLRLGGWNPTSLVRRGVVAKKAADIHHRPIAVDADALEAYSVNGGFGCVIYGSDLETRGLTMPTFQDVLTAARTLSAADRLRLVDSLWEDVPPDDWPLPSEQWIAEAQRRSAEYDEGRMSAATWPEVQARARRKAGLDGRDGDR
jgi:putative addiction module component (TIGR02574 family)